MAAKYIRPLARGREEDFSRPCDPGCRAARIGAMILKSKPRTDISGTGPEAGWGIRLAAHQDPAAVTEPLPEYSEPTSWLLDVRDHRDRQAFAKLFNHFAPRLKAMLMRGGLRDGRAEDVVQEVMLSVWHKAHQFDPHRADASGWIYRIARNRHIDLIRRGPAIAEDLPEIADENEPDAFQILALEQEQTALRAALRRLAPEQSRLLQKAYFEDMPHTEISAVTGLPLGTIKSRIRLGLARIRRELSDLRSS